MEERKSDELPVPDYAVGTHMLVVDPNMASLTRTTSVLEETTYRVTGTQQPEEALSLLKERKMTSYGMDQLNSPLAFKCIQHGATQFYVKPVSSEDAKCLWQHVFSRGQKKTADDDVRSEENELYQSDNSDKLMRNSDKGKGKDIDIPAKENQKRKGSDFLNKATESGDTKRNSEAATKKMRNFDKNSIQWNDELQAKFINILLKNSGKAIPAAAQQESGTMNKTMLPPTSTYLQNTKGGGYPNSKTVPNARYAGKDIQSIPYYNSITGAENEQYGTWNLSLFPGSQSFDTMKQNLRKDIGHVGTMSGASSINKTSVLLYNNNKLAVNNIAENESNLRGRIDQIRHAYRTNTQSGKESFIPNYGYYGSGSLNVGRSAPSVCPPHQVQSSYASSKNYVHSLMPNYDSLQKETTGIYQTVNLQYSNSNYNQLPSNDVAMENILPANDLGRGNLDDFGVKCSGQEALKKAGASNILQPAEDDMVFDEMIVEMQNDSANNDLRSLGFNNSSNL